MLALSALWRSDKSKQYLQGGMICLFLIFPVYCYEHHLALMVIPVVLSFRFCWSKQIFLKACFVVSLFFLGWPLYMLRGTQKLVPNLTWLLQESKFFAIISMLIMCVAGAYFSQREDRDNDSSSCSDGVK